MKKLALAVAVAAVGFMGMASAVRADSVAYTTSGVFGYNNSDTVLLAGPGSNFIQVQYTPSTFGVADIGVAGGLDLGDITITGQADPNTSTQDLVSALNGTSFTLSITQTAPPVTGSSTGTVGSTVNVTGTLQISSVDNDYGFVLDFHGASADIGSGPTYHYIPVNFSVGGTIQEDQSGLRTYSASQNINGTVTATSVPVPAAAWGGMGLMGLLGVAQIARRRAAAC